MSATVESHLDDSAYASGTHKRGANSASLVDTDALFKTCGVASGMLVKNTTDGSSGTIANDSDVTETEIAVTLSGGTDNDWDVSDSYEIYRSGTEDSFVSSIWVDRSHGWKVTDESQVTDFGWFPEDVDLDVDDDGHRLPDDQAPFGPGQPERSR